MAHTPPPNNLGDSQASSNPLAGSPQSPTPGGSFNATLTTTTAGAGGATGSPAGSLTRNVFSRHGSTASGLYKMGGASARSFPRVPTNLSMESLDEMESKKRLESVLSAAGVGEDFLTQYANQLLVAGISSETQMGQATEQELIGYGLMRAHSMKVVRYFQDLKKKGMPPPTPSEGQLSSTLGTPYIAHPGSFPGTPGEKTQGQQAAILVKDFQCHCCMELILSPRSISCGHSFCFRCLESWCEQHTNPSCPLCRSPMVSKAGERYTIPAVNQMINNLVLKLFPNHALRMQQLQDEQQNRAEMVKQEHQFTRHPPNSTMVKILKSSAALGSVTDALECAMLQLPRAEFLSVKKRWNNSCDTTPVRLEGLLFNVSAPQLHAIALGHLNIRPGDSVLDVGSGSGIVTAWASLLSGPKAKIIHGVDLRDDILHYSLRNLEKQRRFRAPLSDPSGRMECICACNTLSNSPLSSPNTALNKRASTFVSDGANENWEEAIAKATAGGDESAEADLSPRSLGDRLNTPLKLNGVHRLFRQGDVLSGVVHQVFKPVSGDHDEKKGQEDYPLDHSMPISFKVIRTFIAEDADAEEKRFSEDAPHYSTSPTPISSPALLASTPNDEGASPEIEPMPCLPGANTHQRHVDPACQEKDDESTKNPSTMGSRAATSEYKPKCALRMGVEVLITAGRAVDDSTTRISRAFATVECNDEDILFTEVQVLTEQTYRSRPYHFGRTPANPGEPVSFVKYRLVPSAPSTLINDAVDGTPIQNIAVTVETARTGSRLASAELQPSALKPMEANEDLALVTKSSNIEKSLSNIRMFRANALDIEAAPMKVVKDVFGGYDKIYLGASPGSKATFKVLVDWLKPGGVMCVPYEGYMSVVRKSSEDGSISVEKHASVNFSTLESPASQQSDVTLHDIPAAVVTGKTADGVELDGAAREAAALTFLDSKATRLPAADDTTVGGRHISVGMEKSFVTTCCRVPVFGKVIRSLDSVLGEEFSFPDGRGCLIDTSIVRHKDNRRGGAKRLRYWRPSSIEREQTGTDATAPTTTDGEDSSPAPAFYDPIGCRVQLVACDCGKPIGAEILEAPVEVGATGPFLPGRTLLCMSYVEPPFERPTSEEDIDREEKISCKKCKKLISETRHVLDRTKEVKNATSGRVEAACFVNSVRSADGNVGLMTHSKLSKPDGGNPHVIACHIACGGCNTVLGYKTIAPKNIYSVASYTTDLWEVQRYCLLVNKVTNVSAASDPRQVTLGRLLSRSLGSDGGGNVGAQLYASLVESFANLSGASQEGSTTTFTLNLGSGGGEEQDEDEDEDFGEEGET